MMKLKLILFISIVFCIGCKGQEIDIYKYAKIDEDTIWVKATFEVYSRLSHLDAEPFVVCLRDQYAYRFGDVEMHMEHSDYRQLYSKALGVPVDSLEKYSDDEFKLQLEEYYQTRTNQDFFSKLHKPFELTMIQTINDEGTRSIVSCKKRNFKYELEKRNDKWIIVDFGPLTKYNRTDE